MADTSDSPKKDETTQDDLDTQSQEGAASEQTETPEPEIQEAEIIEGAAAKEPVQDAEPPAAPASQQPTQPARSGGGFGKLLFAGVLGGGVTAGALVALLMSGQLELGSDDKYDESDNGNSERLAALETQQAELTSLQAAIDKRLAALKANIDDNTNSFGAATRKSLANEEKITAIETVISPANKDSSFSQLEQGQANLQTSLSQIQSNLITMQDRLSSLETALANKIDTEPATEQIAELSQNMSITQQSITDQAAKISEFGTEIAALKDKFAEFGTVAERQQQSQKSLLLSTLQMAEQKLADGKSAVTELNVLKQLDTPANLSEDLSNAMTDGLPKTDDLVQAFLTDIAKAETAAEESSFLGPLSGLVTIRTQSDTAKRADQRKVVNAIKRRAFDEAAIAWSGLPDADKTATASWKENLLDRQIALSQELNSLKEGQPVESN